MSFDNETLTQDQAQSLRTSTTEQHSRQIFYGWWVVLASAIGLFWGVPISVYSFSVFFKPLMQEFHAGRAAVSLAFTLKLIAAALCATPIGWLTDRYGPRRVILTGTGIFGSILLGESALFRQHRSVLLLLRALGFLCRRCWPNTLWVFSVALVRQTSRLGSGPHDARNRRRGRDHAISRANTDRAIRLEDSLLNSWRSGSAHLLAGSGLLSEGEARGLRSLIGWSICKNGRH